MKINYDSLERANLRSQLSTSPNSREGSEMNGDNGEFVEWSEQAAEQLLELTDEEFETALAEAMAQLAAEAAPQPKG